LLKHFIIIIFFKISLLKIYMYQKINNILLTSMYLE
jgi:hypothetical protein